MSVITLSVEYGIISGVTKGWHVQVCGKNVTTVIANLFQHKFLTNEGLRPVRTSAWIITSAQEPMLGTDRDRFPIGKVTEYLDILVKDYRYKIVASHAMAQEYSTTSVWTLQRE